MLTTNICAPDDALEPNDTIAQATALARGNPRTGIACPHNSDYFAVELFAGTAATLDATFAHLFGDVDIALRDGRGTVVARARSETNTETITFTPQTTGTYYAQVYAWPPDYAANRYRLVLSGAAPTVPDAPTNVVATAGSGEARVSRAPATTCRRTRSSTQVTGACSALGRCPRWRPVPSNAGGVP